MRLRGRDFLTMRSYTRSELAEIIRTARLLKHRIQNGEELNLLRGKTLLMIFQKPSTRTRISFEIAMRQLGGHVVYLNWNELQLGRGETIADTARVIERYADAVVIRALSHEHIEEFAKNASIPVINGLSDTHHPCQALSDIMTIEDKKGLENIKLAWVGDSTNVCNSLLIVCSIFGVDVSVACPKGYEPKASVLEWVLEKAKETGTKIEVTHDVKKAVSSADVIYTDTFVSMGLEKEREERLRVFVPAYQVNSTLFKYAKKDAIFMHCLPAKRGEEVTDDVIDGPHSVVWDQAENRLHLQRGLLYLLLS